MVEMAELILDEVSSAIQAEGWVFNTEYSYPFTPDGNGNVIIPYNVLSLDSNGLKDEFLVIRQGKLYDKATHSFVFEGEQLLDVNGSLSLKIYLKLIKSTQPSVQPTSSLVVLWAPKRLSLSVSVKK